MFFNCLSVQADRNFILHVVNYAWILFLMGISFLVWIHGFGLEKDILEGTSLAVEFKQESDDQEVAHFKKWLEEQSEVLKGSVSMVDESELSQVLTDELNSDSLLSGAKAYFPKIFTFKLNKESFRKDRFSAFKERVEKRKSVRKLYYQNELTEDLEKAIARLKMGFMFITMLFTIIGILISQYLAQIFVSSRIDIIQNYHQMGASLQVIQKPYLKRAWSLGLASALLSVFLMGLMIMFLYYVLPWAYEWVDTIKFLVVVFIILILGPTLQSELVRRKINALIR